MLGVNPSVRVRNDLQRDLVDARKIFPRTVEQLRQFAIEPARQMALRRADLFLDEMKIVQQPFRRRCDDAVFFNKQSPLIVIAQNFFVGREARQQQVRPTAIFHAAILRKIARGLFEQINAQQFAAQRFFIRRNLRCFCSITN